LVLATAVHPGAGGERLAIVRWGAQGDPAGKLPAFYGARRNAGHTATVDHPSGLRACSSARDANWVTKSKNIKPD